VYKTRITDLHLSTMPLLQWRRASSMARSVLSCCFGSSRSVMHVLYTPFAAFPIHAIINWIQIWIWSPLRS